MSTIEQQKETEQKFFEILDLLVKIGQHDKPCKLEVDYDGTRFSGRRIFVSNITADEWNPAPQPKRMPVGITVETVKTMRHRKEP